MKKFVREFIDISIFIVLLISFFLVYSYSKTKTELPKYAISSKETSVLDVKAIIVIGSNEFDIILADDNRVDGRLKINVPEDCKSKIIEIINKATLPKIVLFDYVDDMWIMDLKLTIDGKQISLTDYLIENKMFFKTEEK